MTIIVRRIGPTQWHKLRKAGVCRCGLCEIVGCWESKISRVIFLEAE